MTHMPRVSTQVRSLLRSWRNTAREFFTPAPMPTTVRCGRFTLQCLDNHPLLNFAKTQPARDMCVEIAARELGAKYQGRPMIDVGANIGDTAARMASASTNPLVLVEASDVFLPFLQENAARLGVPTQIVTALVSDGLDVAGSLRHTAGTAFIEESSASPSMKTLRLCEIAPSDTCFIKIDTDGHDYRILLDSIEWLGSTVPAVLYENQVRTEAELALANETLEALRRVGYAWFVVWEDRGLHVASTHDLDVLRDLNRFLLKTSTLPSRPGIFNFDILCLSDRDTDIYHRVRDAYDRS